VQCACIPGYVTGHAAGSSDHGFMSLINLNTLRVHSVLPSDPQAFASGCQRKKFIVKAQLPISKIFSDLSTAVFLHTECIEPMFFLNFMSKPNI